MKRAVVLLALVICAIHGAPASAQIGGEEREEKYLQLPHRYQIFVDGAIALPTDPGLFNDFWNTAFQFGIGGGIVIFPWLEINGTFNTSSFSNNSIVSKEKLHYSGFEEVEGGMNVDLQPRHQPLSAKPSSFVMRPASFASFSSGQPSVFTSA